MIAAWSSIENGFLLEQLTWNIEIQNNQTPI